VAEHVVQLARAAQPHLDRLPALLLHGRAAERASELLVTKVYLSLTHTESAAGAVVVAERD
jgi:phosphopantetheinyl transferase (holo-ACP synthase)